MPHNEGSPDRYVHDDATNLDIRDLTFAADKVDASGTVLGAGTNNIGDVDVLTLPADPLGANADAAVITDTTGTVSGKLRGLVKWAYERMPSSLGQKARGDSLSVTLSTSDEAELLSIDIGVGDIRSALLPRQDPATLANISDTATSTTLQAANSDRYGWSCYNDSDQALYIKFGATASATSFTVKLGPGDFYEMPTPCYGGVIDGIWDADSTGAARVTELEF